MSKFAEQQKAYKTDKEHAFQYEKMRREKLSGLCFDIAKIFCAGLVIGGITPLLNNSDAGEYNIRMLIVGIIVVLLSVAFGITILNQKSKI